MAAAVVAAVLLVLAACHLFWAAGGRAGKAAAIPTRDGRPVIVPTPLGTALIGVTLIAAAALILATAGHVGTGVPRWALREGSAVLAAAFALRAVGEFRYVGFFKSIRGSRFSRLDTWVYSPLCLGLAVLIGAVAFD